MNNLQIAAWENAEPYEHTCDEQRCVWVLMRKRGNCPMCTDDDHFLDIGDMDEPEENTFD